MNVNWQQNRESGIGTTTVRRRLARELLIILAFFVFTAAMTWPWVTRMRDAVADEGDPYMIAWTLWWDYHQTFTDLLHLFNGNVFYPYKYTLAFSEHEYGIAVLLFPLFALGLRALTVHSFATFCGFAFCGYGAFRLTRTLTDSKGSAWVAGIVFAFVPYRFHVLSHLHYLFAAWIPLLLEALVLFARKRSWWRAAWLGISFAMNALTCISYFVLTLVPLILSVLFLVVHYRIERDRSFWLRGGVAIGAASLLLLPFMLPYYFVMKLYGFVRTQAEVTEHSATPLHWLVAENRNKLWRGFGAALPDSSKHKLFPGLLPLLLAMFAFFRSPNEDQAPNRPEQVQANGRTVLVRVLDGLVLAATIIALLTIGFRDSEVTSFAAKIFRSVPPAGALFILMVLTVARLSLAYPGRFSWARDNNLIDSIRSARRGDAFALGLVWTICGFLGSLGTNVFTNQLLYEFVPIFRAIRIPTHWAMIAYVGLAVLAGSGAQYLVERFRAWRPPLRPALMFAVVAAMILFELRAAPLKFVRGKVDPNEVTLRLKQTPMRGGLVELPHDLSISAPHLYMLRAADHEKPLVNATSSFVSPVTDQIARMNAASPIDPNLLDLLEKIPASYLVIHMALVAPEKRSDYESFLGRGMESRRLRFVRNFNDGDLLFAVVKTEPEVQMEGAVPFGNIQPWAELIRKDSINLLGQYQSASQTLHRFYIASYCELPRYSEFMREIESLAQGVATGTDDAEKIELNLREFAQHWVQSEAFKARYESMTNARFVDQLAANAGITLNNVDRAALVEKLNSGAISRAEVLLSIVKEKSFVEKENRRSLVLLHYFGFLHRNPADPPDNNLDGFNYWLYEGDIGQLSQAFRESVEYRRMHEH